MKTIYLVLSKSPTLLSRSIGWITKEEYTHSSISFSNTLQPMYSSGRKYPLLNLPASVKEEPFDRSFYKVFHKTKVGVYSLEVSDESFSKIRQFVLTELAKKTPFNVWGLLFCRYNIDHPRPGHYFCSEFVSTALLKGGVDILRKPNLYHPADFLKIKGIRLRYTGKVEDFTAEGFHIED